MAVSRLQLTLRSPDLTASFEQVDSIAVTTTMGPTIIFPQHASLVGTINFSQLVIKCGQEETRYMVRNGLIYIDREMNCVAISALFCDLVAASNIDTVSQYLQQVEQLLAEGKELAPIQYTYLKNERLALIEQIKVLKQQ